MNPTINDFLLLLPYLLAAFSLIVTIDHLFIIPNRLINTLGTVISYAKNKCRQNHQMVYAPEFELYIEGKRHTATNDLWSSTKSYEIGQCAPVSYLPGNEHHAYISNRTRPFLLSIGAIIGFAPMLIVIDKYGLSYAGLTIFSLSAYCFYVAFLNVNISKKLSLLFIKKDVMAN